MSLITLKISLSLDWPSKFWPKKTLKSKIKIKAQQHNVTDWSWTQRIWQCCCWTELLICWLFKFKSRRGAKWQPVKPSPNSILPSLDLGSWIKGQGEFSSYSPVRWYIWNAPDNKSKCIIVVYRTYQMGLWQKFHMICIVFYPSICTFIWYSLYTS